MERHSLHACAVPAGGGTEPVRERMKKDLARGCVGSETDGAVAQAVHCARQGTRTEGTTREAPAGVAQCATRTAVRSSPREEQNPLPPHPRAPEEQGQERNTLQLSGRTPRSPGTAGGNVNWCSHCGERYGSSSNLKKGTTSDSSLGI